MSLPTFSAPSPHPHASFLLQHHPLLLSPDPKISPCIPLRLLLVHIMNILVFITILKCALFRSGILFQLTYFLLPYLYIRKRFYLCCLELILRYHSPYFFFHKTCSDFIWKVLFSNVPHIRFQSVLLKLKPPNKHTTHS